MQFHLKSGLSLGYLTRGSGPVVVMLHPIGMRASFWEPVIGEIEADFRAIAFDLRGHGSSEVPDRAFRLADLADDVAEATAVLAADRECIVVGCSMGGMVAQALALRHPDRVRGLVLTNTSHTLSDEGRKMIRQRGEAAREGMPGLVDTTIDRWFSKSFREASPEIVAGTREYLLGIDPVVHAWGWEAISELDHGERLSGISVPTIVATGSDDVSTPPAAAKAILEAMPHATYEEAPGAGHMTPLEQPQMLSRWIREVAERAD